jgi:hypothetical protein
VIPGTCSTLRPLPDLRRLTILVECGWLLESVLTFSTSLLPRLDHLTLIMRTTSTWFSHQQSVDGHSLSASLRSLSSGCSVSLDLLTLSRNKVIGLDSLLTTLSLVSKAAHYFVDERHTMPLPNVHTRSSFRIVVGNNSRVKRYLSTQWVGATASRKRMRRLTLDDPMRDNILSQMLNDDDESFDELQHVIVFGDRIGPVEPLIGLIERILIRAPYLVRLSIADNSLMVHRLLSLTNIAECSLVSHFSQ